MKRRYLGRVSFLLMVCASGMPIAGCGEINEASSDSSVGGNAAATSEPNGNGGAQTTTTKTTTATGGKASTTTNGASTPLTCTGDDAKFSFFLTSQAALIAESGSQDGFGGDLGGLSGADALCQKIAEKSAPCHKGTVTWRAFLSTSTVNAKDRIGKGPWYDRRGRLLAANLTNLLKDRPVGADTAIVNDFPNENGVCNHSPDGKQVDNHQIITGTGTDGNVYKQTATSSGGFPGAQNSCLETWSVAAATCKGWTTKERVGCPRVGHSWPAMSGTNWMSVWNESGCAPGGTIVEEGGTDNSRQIGSAGGYGGFYCFAMTGG